MTGPRIIRVRNWKLDIERPPISETERVVDYEVSGTFEIDFINIALMDEIAAQDFSGIRQLHEQERNGTLQNPETRFAKPLPKRT